ncbi:hypothetical protein BBP40_006655 [Aspergillus hancockii]|nr:hypothetical protein BBP40_006655 [Aspergillus hancockii]
MQHYKRQTLQPAESPADVVISNFPLVDEAGLMDNQIDHKSLAMDSPFVPSFDEYDQQIAGAIASPTSELHTLQQLADRSVLNANHQTTLHSSNNPLPGEQMTSWSTAIGQNERCFRNEWYRGYPPANLPSRWPNETLWDPQTPFPMPDTIFDESPSSGNNWNQRSNLQSAYPLNANGSRGLPRRKSRYFLQRSGSRVTPNFIRNPFLAPDPMQRWQNSPPEDEPASMSAIMNTLKNLPPETSQSGGFDVGSSPVVQGCDPFSGFRRQTSIASSQSSAHSVSSHQSATSTRSETSKRSHNSLPNPNKRSAGRVRKGKIANSSRRFCCTFCCDRFKTKYDWARHEKSLHLSLERWACAPYGGSVASPLTGQRHCAYCNVLDPQPEHLEEHNYQTCLDGTRTFRRKDHLVQHLRLTHHLDVIPSIDDWKTPAPIVTSRCGFCDRKLPSWEERADHLASHFRNGSSMDDWRGDHEFPPEIAEHVTNALPPYYIGADSRCLVPFSVTNIHARDQLDQITSRLDWNSVIDNTAPNDITQASAYDQPSDNPLRSFLEPLAMYLGRFTRQKLEQGIVPTDEMLQQESRRLVYDCEDPWNQTIFDNPEWLAAFRRQHIEQSIIPETEEQALFQLSNLSFRQQLNMGNALP